MQHVLALDSRLLAVAPTARSRGIGAAPTRHMLTLGRERGVSRVVMIRNPNASNLMGGFKGS
ncbi:MULTISPECIES: hypothetical protein [Cryobacterium]|uniref:GNAT family N-acetyltransferase n=1 Tax=Cryobacterium breve TaxID=1259258 RepID=A0ABY2IVM4_9MICO|nr:MULTISPECIES: hypothetical protein [Cryobacterium]TFC95616.1 hypothetical protein E3T20_05760 [Cryobacterium sp. TmT3-12]TFC95673.1 hypothetical protein E3O65_14350 [Cryobacterium breve]